MKIKNVITSVFMMFLLSFSTHLVAQDRDGNKDADKIVEVDERQKLQNDAQKAIDAFKAEDGAMNGYLNDAAGYAVFPNVGKGAWILGGAAGNGIVYEKGNMIGYTELRQIDVGFQIGGQAFSEIIIFRSQEALDNFKKGNFKFEGSVSAVIIDKGATKALQFENGIGVAIMTKGGAMVGISVGGQKFNYGAIK